MPPSKAPKSPRQSAPAGASIEEPTATHAQPTDAVLSDGDREGVLSAMGIKLKLTLFVIAVLAMLGFAMVGLVTQIFNELTPSTRRDLAWKTERGAVELAKRLEYAIVIGDRDMLVAEAADYTHDADVVGLVVENAEGERLFVDGDDSQWTALRATQTGVSHDYAEMLGAWAGAEIEGAPVGRVGLFVSKERIFAGERLQERMVLATMLGAALALVLCLLFVNLYIGPILRLTGEAFERLEVTTEKALEAARIKSQFLANMSHEIRTPMNGILGMISLLRRTKLSGNQRRYSQTIENSARALLSIIDDVLDFSKLDAGKLVLRPSDFELSELLQEVMELLAPKAHAKQLELLFTQDKDVPDALHADQDRLRQIITNLVGNAIKFTDRGHIALHASLVERGEDDVKLAFAVTDTGMGIAAADLQALFQSFSQVDGSLTRAHGGTGLGLAISRQLAQAMHGDIEVSSVVGEGSTFTFTIRARLRGSGRVRSLPSREAQVLIVSATQMQREHLRALTEAWGMRAKVVAACAEGVAAIAETGFDAVVLDVPVGMPDEDHPNLVDMCAVEDIPLLMLASSAEPIEAPMVGARQIAVPKPIRASELYNGLVGLLDGTLRPSDFAPEARGGESDAPGALPSLRPSPQGNGPRILVVDDNAINRMVAVELLADMGYATDTATNGLEAVEKVEQGDFKAVLMDCQMPVMDGYEAVRRIRKLGGEASRVPVIAVTAHALVGDRDKVIQAGMDDYASKPIKPRSLHRILQHWLRRPTGDASIAPVGDQEAVEYESVAPEGDEGLVLDPQCRRPARAVEIFVDVMAAEAQTLQAHAEANDVEQVRAQAHKMKGACLSLGVERCAALCAHIEDRARDGAIDGDAVVRVPLEIDRAIDALRGVGETRQAEAP